LWMNAITLDCAGMGVPNDYNMMFKPSQGKSVKCAYSNGALMNSDTYQFDTGAPRKYPSDVIATSWDPLWQNAPIADCTNLWFGADMIMNPNGQSVKCSATGATFRFLNGELRKYPSDGIATTWDPNWVDAPVTQCAGLSYGTDMNIRVGASVKCSATSDTFRFTSPPSLRKYPNRLVAGSWDATWWSAPVVDCSGIATGNYMLMNIPEGTSVKCRSDSKTYRFTTARELRWYPTSTIALSWDTNWEIAPLADCNGFPRGLDMQKKNA
jgi:hypothetical protein